MSILDAMDVDVSCPGCGRQFTINIGQAHRVRRTTCPGCGESIKLQFAGDDLGKIERSYQDLEQQVRKLGGTIDIRK